ncbi:MAG: DUF305 domain-containing protein [Gemmatimonadota bacterium]|nr:DUF305 domain-containing protein [Gemmatimonadota bacterium]MDZ4864241.1 DUF305 domain-containing protein [Gemmatimonadota bacterium]
MIEMISRVRVAPLLVALTLVASGTATGASAQASAQDAGQHPFYTAADVAFMTGMISHHAQAVLIAGWAPSHGASPSLRALCERIVVGQQDEITLMKRWLRDRREPVPDGDASHGMMPGMDHAMMPMMAGMLTAEQLVQLDQARGPEFDRMFLTFMIQHHQGAIVMVDQLFGSKGAGEEERVFRFASDVYADQTTEIDRMQKMLAALPSEGRSP